MPFVAVCVLRELLSAQLSSTSSHDDASAAFLSLGVLLLRLNHSIDKGAVVRASQIGFGQASIVIHWP